MPISTSRPRIGSSRRRGRRLPADQFQLGATRLEHFQEKWKPVFRPKMRQCNNSGAVSASRLCETALAPHPTHGSSGMMGRMFTVDGLTLLSRLTGCARDILLAAVLGAGPVADAFFVALRLPNHFRAIFAEGAFNAAFVPAYARIRETGGPVAAKLFADRIFTLLFVSQVLLVAVALLYTPAVISLLAPGFAQVSERFQLAVELTRITFPYLLLMTLVTLYGGI